MYIMKLTNTRRRRLGLGLLRFGSGKLAGVSVYLFRFHFIIDWAEL